MRQFEAKTMPVSGERIVPPIIAAMPTIAQRPASPRRSGAAEGAERAAHHQQRREHAARSAGTERDGPDERLCHQQAREPARRASRRAASAWMVS